MTVNVLVQVLYNYLQPIISVYLKDIVVKFSGQNGVEMWSEICCTVPR